MLRAVSVLLKGGYTASSKLFKKASVNVYFKSCKQKSRADKLDLSAF